MVRLERTGWAIRRLLMGSPSYRVQAEGSAGHTVRLRQPPDRLPATPIAQRVLSAFAGGDSMPFERLIKTVADQLYDEELRKGAGILDIGLFGSRLFHEEVVRELHAGDGIFWDIKKSESH